MMHDRVTSPPSAPPERRLTILVADDEPMIVNALRLLLERRGHEVVVASDAYAALERLGDRSFDAVIVDAHMPGGGASVLDHLEASGFAGMRVLMTGDLTTRAQNRYHGLRLLQKPFSFPSVIPLLEEGLSP